MNFDAFPSGYGPGRKRSELEGSPLGRRTCVRQGQDGAGSCHGLQITACAPDQGEGGGRGKREEGEGGSRRKMRRRRRRQGQEEEAGSGYARFPFRAR